MATAAQSGNDGDCVLNRQGYLKISERELRQSAIASRSPRFSNAPDIATVDDIRHFQLHLARTGARHPQPQPCCDLVVVFVPPAACHCILIFNGKFDMVEKIADIFNPRHNALGNLDARLVLDAQYQLELLEPVEAEVVTEVSVVNDTLYVNTYIVSNDSANFVDLKIYRFRV